MYTIPVKWQTPPSVPALAPQDVHVWRIDLQAAPEKVTAALALLDAEEQARAGRFKFAEHRRRFVMAHAGLRQILAGYVQQPAAALHFQTGEHGKPMLADYPHCQFNLAHSADVALCAVTLHALVGIDVESVRQWQDMLPLAERFFSAQEQALLQHLPAETQAQRFFRLWTCKEALIKAQGLGLAHWLDKFIVDIRSGQPAAPVKIAGDAQAAAHWQLFEFMPALHYAAALAVHGRNNRPHFLQWPFSKEAK